MLHISLQTFQYYLLLDCHHQGKYNYYYHLQNNLSQTENHLELHSRIMIAYYYYNPMLKPRDTKFLENMCYQHIICLLFHFLAINLLPLAAIGGIFQPPCGLLFDIDITLPSESEGLTHNSHVRLLLEVPT